MQDMYQEIYQSPEKVDEAIEGETTFSKYDGRNERASKQRSVCLTCPSEDPAAEYETENHKRAVTCLSSALIAGDTDAWGTTSKAWSKFLERKEVMAIVIAALNALGLDNVNLVLELVRRGTGQPLPPLLSYKDEAAHWADMAPTEELMAYVVTCFNRLPPTAQADFLEFAQKRIAA